MNHVLLYAFSYKLLRLFHSYTNGTHLKEQSDLSPSHSLSIIHSEISQLEVPLFLLAPIWADSFSYLEPVCCSMSSSNCCFLNCTQVSQEAGQLVWYSHLLKNFPQGTPLLLAFYPGKKNDDLYSYFLCEYWTIRLHSICIL